MQTKSGFIAIIGRPNVGKSTLLNKILGTPVSITANKPQTTRHRILGIKTFENNQLIFIDTPGIHKKNSKAINKVMNKAAKSSIADSDAVIFVVEALKWNDEDEIALNSIKKYDIKNPVFLVINKVDIVKDKQKLLPFLEEITAKFKFADVFPTSAAKDKKFAKLERKLIKAIPFGPHYFEAHSITDKNLSFRLREIIREKLTRMLGHELPFSLTVQTEKILQEEKLTTVHAIIWVDRSSHKPIVIGKGGAKLKEVGTLARLHMEKMLGTKVNLKLWVKVKSGWSDSSKALQDFGYLDEE